MRFPGALAAMVLVVSGCATAGAPNSSIADTRPRLLALLDGDWVMAGDVLGKPVEYRLAVKPTLRRSFTELHMTDVRQPPEYEARVFIGYDGKSGQVIVHWLDVFGGKASIPHGTGHLTNDTIEFTIPYQEGPFRDVLRLDPGAGSWRFTIEASDGSGGWKHFAAYDIKRVR